MQCPAGGSIKNNPKVNNLINQRKMLNYIKEGSITQDAKSWCDSEYISCT